MQWKPRRWVVLAAVLGLSVPGCGGSYDSAWDDPSATETSEEGQTEEGQSRRAELIAEGDAAWLERDDPDRIRAAIAVWQQAVEIDGSDHETWVKLARANYFLADGHLRFEEDAPLQETYQTAIQAAERALRALSPEFAQQMAAGELPQDAVAVLEADAVPALYWRAAALGRWAQQDGFATVLSFKDEIRAVMTRCLELDRYYFFAGPDRYFGAFFSIAPTYAGGDLDRSRQHFEESIRREPNYFGSHVLFAENYAVKSQDRELFESELRYVLDGDPNSLEGAEPENRAEVRKATALMERIDELFE